MGFLRHKIGRFRKKHLNVEDWVGWDQVKYNAEQIKSMCEDVDFKPKREKTYDDFDTWMRSLSMTDKDLPAYLKRTKISLLIYAGVGTLLLIYSLYLFFHVHFLLGFYTLLISLLLLANALLQWKQWVLVSIRRGRCSFRNLIKHTQELLKK